MDARIVEFSEVLRQNGLKVSVSESLDAARAVVEVGVENRELMRAALRATLCKRASDVPTFERAFELYFSGTLKTLQDLDRSLADRIREEGLLEGDELTMIVAWLSQMRLSPLTDAVMRGDVGQLAQLMRGAALQLDFSRLQASLQTSFFTRRMLAGLGIESMRRDLLDINHELQARGVSAQGLSIVSKELRSALQRVEDSARAEVARQTSARLRKNSGGMNERNFYTLSPAEVQRMKTAVKALAEKLKSRLVRRQRTRKKGQLNPIRTLRKNMSSGGVPMQPVFRLRRPQRPEVMVLCDISDSVRNASRMMLLFTWTLQSLFSRVRSFVFVSELGEVTSHFRNVEPDIAIERAVSGEAVSVAGNSNYGHAFLTFSRQFLPSVTRRTTVLIIGDGRNNYNPPQLWALEEMKRKAKRLVWLCTEPQSSWGFGDSMMLSFAKACHQVIPVTSLSELELAALQWVR